MTSPSSSKKTDANGKLDQPVVAVCDCGVQTRYVTFRNLKNKWPHCKCNQPMKVKGNADAPIPTPD